MNELFWLLDSVSIKRTYAKYICIRVAFSRENPLESRRWWQCGKSPSFSTLYNSLGGVGDGGGLLVACWERE